MTDDPPIVQATREFLAECDRTPKRLVYPTKALYNDMYMHSIHTSKPPLFQGIPIGRSESADEPFAVFREEVPINQ